MRKTLLFLIFITAIGNSFSQVDSATVSQLRKFEFGGLYRSTVSFNLFGVTGIVGASYDCLISEHWGFEAGLGYAGAGFGFEFYPWKVMRGRTRLKFTTRNVYQYDYSTHLMNHSVGLGFTFFTKFRWNFALDFGPAYLHSVQNFDYFDPYPADPQNDPFHLMINLKAGYRFSFRAIKYDRERDH